MRKSGIRQALRHGIIILLITIPLAGGCASSPISITDSLKKYSQDKPVATSRWLEAERIVIVSHIPQTFAAGVKEKPNLVGAFMFGTLVGGPVGGAVAATTAEGKDVSSQYQVEMAKRMPDFQRELRTRLEKIVVSRRGNKPVVSVGGPLKYRDDIVLKPTDTVLQVQCLPFVSTAEPGKHFLEIMLFWNLVADGQKYRELRDEMEAAVTDFRERRKNIHELVAEQNRIMALYDGEGNYFYKSPPHTREEWLGNNGQLMQQEMNRGIESVVTQLAQALPAGKGV